MWSNRYHHATVVAEWILYSWYVMTLFDFVGMSSTEWYDQDSVKSAYGYAFCTYLVNKA